MGSGPSKTTESKSDTTPWAPQQSYLLDAFSEAQKAYNENQAAGGYLGDYVAGPSQVQYDAYGNAITQGYAAQGANQGLIDQSSANLTTGSQGAAGVMSSLGQFASTDQTAANIEKAKQYVAGLDIPGQVSAGMLAANQNAAESSVPNIYRSAAQSGGVNSDRAALAQGVVERGLAQQAAGLSSTLNNAAYTQGLSNAQQGNAQQLQALSQQGSVAGALSAAGAAGTNSGISNQQTLNAQITGGASGATGLDQQTLNNEIQKYAAEQGYTTAQLNQLMSIIGKNWGSSTTSNQTTTDNPSLMQNIGSGIGIASALFCDRRIKHVYFPVKSMRFGCQEYLFEYDFAPGQMHIGPMAQDVEKLHPYAVTEVGGVKVILTDLI